MNTRIIDTIAGYFGELAISREKKKFMGMEIYLLGNSKVSMFMNYYIEEPITLFGEEIDATVSSPPKKSLQKIN